ncbi:uncharacterized protein LOC135331796 [Halichondria panicea]|uniref:uncharacterized protein LOC135331796 n=1 Tax=Halichondria panicea TaxID=6063 RepID=UPI00312B9EB9
MTTTSGYVRLNIGGEIFATSKTTLLSAGESFFSSLLSERHESARDDTGAYFIDRSPKYFGSILHYLRTNNLELPSALNRQSLQLEAEFYGIQKIVDHLKHLESDKQNAESIKKNAAVVPFSKISGCYIDSEDRTAFLFGVDGKLTYVTGTQAFTQAMVIRNHPTVPNEWKVDPIHSHSFAIFYQQHVSRGTYKMNTEGNGMVITLPTGGSSSQELRKSLATLSDDSGTLCVTSFSSAGGGKCVFQCDHSNPHHFHVYNFKNF